MSIGGIDETFPAPRIERDEALRVALLVEGSLVIGDSGSRDAGLQPRLGGDAAVERRVERVVRRDAHSDRPVRKIAEELLAQHRSAVVIDLAQGADQETDVAERQGRTRDPFFARDGRVRRDPFCAASRGHPVGGHVVRAPKAVLEQLDLGRDVQPGELRGLLAQTTDDAGRGPSREWRAVRRKPWRESGLPRDRALPDWRPWPSHSARTGRWPRWTCGLAGKGPPKRRANGENR